MLLNLLPLASATLDKLHNVPTKFWINVGLFVGIIVVLVVIVRFLRNMNKIVLGVILFMIFALVGFNWIYERNEPEFLTPVIDPIAQFFPSKGAYETKQTLNPDEKAPKSTKAKPGEKTPAPTPPKK